MGQYSRATSDGNLIASRCHMCGRLSPRFEAAMPSISPPDRGPTPPAITSPASPPHRRTDADDPRGPQRFAGVVAALTILAAGSTDERDLRGAVRELVLRERGRGALVEAVIIALKHRVHETIP